MDLDALEIELKKRHRYPYRWLRKQNDLWDGYTNFIYDTFYWEELVQKTKAVYEKEKLDKNEIFQYAANRWYNFQSAKAVEYIFCQMKNVVAAVERDSEKDFFIQNIPFDHKTSVFPAKYPKSLEFAVAHKKDLILWLYENQSREQRFHLKNRLFLIVHANHGEHWKVKADLKFIASRIQLYFEHFDPAKLYSVNFGDTNAKSDIIWAIQP